EKKEQKISYLGKGGYHTTYCQNYYFIEWHKNSILFPRTSFISTREQDFMIKPSFKSSLQLCHRFFNSHISSYHIERFTDSMVLFQNFNNHRCNIRSRNRTSFHILTDRHFSCRRIILQRAGSDDRIIQRTSPQHPVRIMFGYKIRPDHFTPSFPPVRTDRTDHHKSTNPVLLRHFHDFHSPVQIDQKSLIGSGTRSGTRRKYDRIKIFNFFR